LSLKDIDENDARHCAGTDRLDVVGLPANAAPTGALAQSYSIDQTRYFATPDIEQAELKQRIEEASSFPRCTW